MHIGIAGAGLLGRLLAFELSRTGHAVEVFDPAPGPQAPVSGPGTAPYAAGWTAAGMLSPTAELESADEHVFALGLRSLELWPAIVAALGVPVELHRRGAPRGGPAAAQGAGQSCAATARRRGPERPGARRPWRGTRLAAAARGANPHRGNDNLAYWGKLLPVPVVGIAGMDIARTEQASRCGAAGVAVISAITAAASPEAAIAQLQDAVRRGKSQPPATAPRMPPFCPLFDR